MSNIFGQNTTQTTPPTTPQQPPREKKKRGFYITQKGTIIGNFFPYLVSINLWKDESNEQIVLFSLKKVNAPKDRNTPIDFSDAVQLTTRMRVSDLRVLAKLLPKPEV